MFIMHVYSTILYCIVEATPKASVSLESESPGLVSRAQPSVPVGNQQVCACVCLLVGIDLTSRQPTGVCVRAFVGRNRLDSILASYCEPAFTVDYCSTRSSCLHLLLTTMYLMVGVVTKQW